MCDEKFANAWKRLSGEIEQATSAHDALVASKLNWTVSLRPLYRDVLDDQGKPCLGVISSARSIVRDDENIELSTVGDRYKLLQNEKCFDSLDEFIKAGLVKPVAGGMMGLGAHVFLLGKVVDGEGLMDGEAIDLHVLVTNPHGYGCASFGFVPIVRRTGRMLSALAVGNRSGRVKMTHVGNVENKLEMLAASMSLATGEFNVTLDQYEKMRRCGLSSASFRKLVLIAFKKEDCATEEDGHKVAKILESGAMVTNALEAYLALADYLSSDAAGKGASAILKSLWFGQGKAELSRMFDACAQEADNAE